METLPSARHRGVGGGIQHRECGGGEAAVSNACVRLRAKDEDVALILPDPVIRVFVQHFDEFPRSAQEAEPMLRWKLKRACRSKWMRR